MKKAILSSLVLLFVIFNWSLNPAMKQAEAITKVILDSPADSSKITESTPIFRWHVARDTREVVRKYFIAVDTVLTEDFASTPPIWEDSTYGIHRIDTSATTIDTTWVPPAASIVYNGPSFVEWETYFWSVRVQVDSVTKIDTTEAGVIETTWVRDLKYMFGEPFTFFYTTATLIGIPDNLPTIQVGIIWSDDGDTILVEPGIYYENLRFDKKRVILASRFARDMTNTAMIDSTVIDGSRFTRKEDNGSVIYFTSKADSTSGIIGFTIRNGTGTKSAVGTEQKVNGGGIFCEPGSTPTIAYNVITQNQVEDDGGGIFCRRAAPNIFNNIITLNSAGGSGGAIQCYKFIKIKSSASSSPPEGEEEEGRGIEVMPKTNPTPISTESNSKTEEDDWENSLYPRDGTEVFSALSSDPLFKAAQDPNDPPIPVLDYYPKKPKYFDGDTIWLDASESYDPDSSEGDYIKYYSWRGVAYYDCANPDENRPITIKDSNKPIAYFLVKESETKKTGIIGISILLTDSYNGRTLSDTISLNLQRHPDAYAGEDIVVAPVDRDTAWLDGSGSCDINPDDDTTLSFLWTQISGPVNVTIVDSESVMAYFIPYDETYGGTHLFQLKVSDSDSFTIDTQKVTVDRRPVAITFDRLAGFPAKVETTIVRIDTLENEETTIETTFVDTTVATPLPLDASLSFDPDTSVFGDSVIHFIWKGLSHITCTDTFPLSISTDSTEEVQYIRASKGGGIYKVCLYVRDKYGVRSKNTDTLLISVQLRPTADAGPDVIIGRGKDVYLHGDACEMNWDQADSLQYIWHQNPRNPASATWWDSVTGEKLPADYAEAQVVKFISPSGITSGGVFRFALEVKDPYQTSYPHDTVRVIVNALPLAVITRPETNDRFAEGDMVELDGSESYDPDAAIFGDSLKFTWTAVSWPGNTPQPTIENSSEPIAKFVPLKRGNYKFELVVHDTLSENQDPSVLPDFNIATVTVVVESTYACPIIMGNLIWSNTAGLKGGGIDCFQSSAEMINNIFYKNKSGSSGGAICSRFSSAPYIKRNIFFGNISGDSTGGGIADLKAALSPAASIGFRTKTEVANNCFWNNAGGDLYQPPPDVFGNIFEYPRLIDPEYGDFRLECSSRCLDDSIGLLLWLYPEFCETAESLSMISLSLFQNPVATAAAHFLVNTDVPLQAPPAGYVTIGENSPALLDFTSISSTTYRGNFVFTTSGTARVSIYANSIHELPDSLVKDFTVQLIGADKIGRLVSYDNRLRVLFPQGVAKGEIYATCIPVSDNPQYSFKDEDKVALGEAYHLGPLSDFKKELTISFPLDNYDLVEKDKTLFSICRYEKNGWKKQASFLDENSICTRVSSLGVYRLVYDENQEHIAGIPKTYQLLQNYPNPFNPQTMIKYDLPNPGHVNITVYNLLGQKVKTLIDKEQDAGHKSVNWNGKNNEGKDAASGIYFYKIKTGGFEKTKKMVLLK